MKKLTIMLSMFLGAVCLLAGCGDPYARMKLTVSEKEVVLYLDTNEEGDRITTSGSVDVTISGAKKGVSTDVVIVNALENIVSISTSKNGNTTKVTFTPNENATGNSADIIVRSKEGGLSDTIRVTLFEKVKDIQFVDAALAVADGGRMMLGDYLTYTPSNTNQKGVNYAIKEENGFGQIQEYISITKEGQLNVKEGTVSKEGSNILPYDGDRGLYYVTVVIQSQFDQEIVAEKRVYVVSTIKATDVQVRSESSSGKVQLSSVLTDVTVQDNGQTLTLAQVPTYSVVLANNVNANAQFLYSRTLEFILDATSNRRDSMYTMTLLQQKYMQSDRNFVHVSKLGRNNIPNDNYEYNTFRLDQVSIGQDVLLFKIDYSDFEGMLTTYVALDVKVQNFATNIIATVAGEQISTTTDDPTKEDYRTINVLNSLNDQLSSYTCVTLATNYDRQNKDIKLFLTLERSADFDIQAWNETKNHIFACDKEGNPIALDGSSGVDNASSIYLYHDLTPAQVQYAKNRIHLVVRTIYDLNPVADSTDMKFPHEVTQSFPMTIHSNMVEEDVRIENNILLSVVTQDEQTLLVTQPGVYATNFVIGSDRRNTKIVRNVTIDGRVESSVYVNDTLLFYITQLDDLTGGENRITLRANSNVFTGSTYLTLKDSVHGWDFVVKVEVYAPLAYQQEGENFYFASRIPNEDRYKGQWITNSKKEIVLNLGGEEQRKYQTIERIKLATTTARDKNSLQSYVPIEVYNVVNINGQLYEIDLLSTAQISPNSSRYFYFEKGKLYPFNNQYLDEDHPLTLSFTINGYDGNGQAQTVTYTIELLFVDIVERVEMITNRSVIYEKNSLGVLDEKASTSTLDIRCIPHATNDIIARYAYTDALIRSYTVGGESIDIMVSDLMLLNESTGELVADYTRTPFGISKITKLQTIFGSVGNVLQNIFASPISVRVEVFAKQEQLDSLYDTTFVTIDYAQKVQYIFVNNLDEQGIYLEKTNQIANETRYGSKSITLSVLPNEAYNKTLRVVFGDSADRSMIRFASGQVDNEGRIISSNNMLTFYPEHAGEMTIYIAAEDSFKQDGTVVGKYNPDTVIAIRVKVADGSKEYPFEIVDNVDFMNIANGYLNGVNPHHYMLANNIELSRNVQTSAALFAGTFNGSLTGLMQYDAEHVVQKTINGYRVNVQRQDSPYYGLFERVGEEGVLSHIILSNVQASYQLNAKQDSAIGILAGLVEGKIDSNIVSGKLTIVNDLASNNQLTIGGVVGRLTGLACSTSMNQNQPITNYSILLDVTVKNAIVGGLAGFVQGEVEGHNGFVHVLNSSKEETSLIVGGLAGKAEHALLNNNTVQAVLMGDEVGGLVSHVYHSTIQHAVVELLDSTDTQANYALYGTKLVGGLVGRLSNSLVQYSYVRSYNRTTNHYMGDIVLNGTHGEMIGGLVAKHEDNMHTNENVKTVITNSYFDGGLSIDGEDSTKEYMIGSLVGTSSYYVNHVYNEVNHIFIQNAYAKVNNQTDLPLVGNYKGVSDLVNISKIGVSGVTNHTLTTTLTEVNTSTDEEASFEPDVKENEEISAYKLPDNLVSSMNGLDEGYTFYSGNHTLQDIREVREYNDGTHPYISSMKDGKADIQFESVSNNESAYYVYQQTGTSMYYAFPSFVQLDGKTYQVTIDGKYAPVFNLPRQAIVAHNDEYSIKEEYVDGIVTSYSFDKKGVTTIYAQNGQKVSYSNPITYENLVGVNGQNGLWSNTEQVKHLAHREDVYKGENGKGFIDWNILSLYTYYLEDDTTGAFTLNDTLPILVDQTNSKLLYTILPTSLVIQVSDREVDINDNHYYIVDDKTAIVYYNVLQSTGSEPSGNNEYYVGLSTDGVAIATYMLSVNEDFGGDTRVSVMSSNPQVVRVAENNKIVICGIGASTITVRSLLDKDVFDTFTIVTTYGIRGLSLHDANNQTINQSNATEITHQTPSITEYIKEHNSYYSLVATNFVDVVEAGRRYTYQTESSYKLQVTITDFEKASDSDKFPSMIFAGKTVTVNDKGQILIDDVLVKDATFSIDNVEQLSIRARYEGKFLFTITPVITVQGKEYTLEGVKNNYLIALTNKAQSISFDKGAISTSFALSGSGSSSELGVDFVTYNENEKLFMQVLNYKGEELVNGVVVNDFIDHSYQYLMMKLTSKSTIQNSQTSSKTLHYHFELTFNEEEYLKNILSTDEKDSLNNQQYTLIFTCESNESLRKEFMIDMHALPVNEMTSYFYPSAQNKNGEYYPQESASHYLVPNRIGLIKSNVYPLLNDIDYFEYTVSPAYREYIRLTQYYDMGTGYAPYDNTQYLPDFAGIRLQKISSLKNEDTRYSYNGNYYVGVTTSANCPAGGFVELQLTGYKVVNGQPVVVTQAMQSITLEVVALPKVEITVDGGKESILANGYTKQLEVSLTNYSVETDGVVDFTIEKLIDKNQSNYPSDWSWSGELQSSYRINENYVFETIDGTVGDVIRITATVQKVLNGQIEKSTSSVMITIVAYEITAIYLQGYTTNTLELLNGTQNYLLGDIAYRGQPNESNLNDIRLLKFTWNGALSISNETNNAFIQENRYNPFLYQEEGFTNVILKSSMYNNSIKMVRSTSNNCIYVETQKVSNDLPFRMVLRYYYNDAGVPTLYRGQSNIDHYYDLYYDFTITIKENSTYDRPTPIYSVEDFYALANYTEGHYILMNNLTLENHIPFNLNINSLDGNSHLITLKGFDLNNYQDATSANVGLFDTIGENTIVKNLTIDVQSLLTDLNTIQIVIGKKTSTLEDYEKALDNVKLNLEGIATVHFGVVAVTNNGTLTNIKVVNLAQNKGNNYLFVYSTQDFLSGNRTDATIAGLVYENGTNGVITNSFVGMNYAGDNHVVTVNTASYNSSSEENSIYATDTEELQKEDLTTYGFTIAGGKELAGLVGSNSGTIASSYVYGVGLLNTASLANEVYTGGVVVYNGGTIFASFMEGVSNSKDALRANNEYIIESTGLSGGFAYSNTGTIYDCYANVALSTNSGRTGDFIFTNAGTLRNCYTTAISLEATSEGSQEIRTYHGVFTGIGSDLTINNTGSYSGCYYLYLNGETESKVEHASAINGTTSGSNDKTSNFTNIDYFYGYSMGSSSESNEYIWGQTTHGPKLNFAYVDTISIRKMVIETSSAEGGWNYMYFADFGYGVSKNPILISSGEELITAIINNVSLQPDNTLVFGAETKLSANSLSYVVSTIRLVRNIEVTSTLVNQTRVDNRYLRDIIFAGILDGNGMRITIENLNDELYQKSKANFGLFSQIGRVASTAEVKNQDSTTDEEITAEVKNQDSTTDEVTTAEVQTRQAMIKNTKFVLRGNVTSTNAQNVGMLAGSIYNATIIDVEVSASEGATVSGTNAVGGIAGVIGGRSTLLNVSSNISVSSVYDSGIVGKENVTDLNYEFGYKKYNGTPMFTTIKTENVSYAGGIAGILDIVSGKEELAEELRKVSIEANTSNSSKKIFDEDNRTSLFITEQSASRIMNLKVYGYVQIVGEHAGGLFGYVGKTSHVKHSTFELDPTTTQHIVGHHYAGGVVAENYGYLEEVYVDASATARVDLDKTLPSTAYGIELFKEENATALTAIYPTAIGGIAGYSEGAIYNSYSKANVSNTNAFVAGGVIGVAGGINYLSHVYTTAFVNARRVIGGVIGFVREYTDHNTQINPTIYLDYITGYNSWDNVDDKTTNNLTYTLLYNLYKDYYKDENGRQLTFEVRMPQVGNLQAQTYQLNENSKNENSKYELINQTFTRTTYLGSLIGRVGRATGEGTSQTVCEITNIGLQDIVKTRLNSAIDNETGKAIYADLVNHIPTNNNTIYTSTSKFATPNSMPNKTADIVRKYDVLYFEDMLGIQKSYEVLKNGSEFQLDEDNGGYQTKEHIKNYAIITEMVSKNWLVDNQSGQPSIYWYYNPSTNLPIMIEGVNPADNTIENGSDYISKVLQDAKNRLTANKTYSVTQDIKANGLDWNNNTQSELIFQGSLQGSLQGAEDERKEISLRSDQTFNVLRNATINNLNFTINAQDASLHHGRTLYIDGHTAFGYFADYVYHSTIRNVNITLLLPESVSMNGYLNMVNDYYGLIFGYVVDSTIENVTVTIKTENGKSITLTNARYENFGIFAGGMQSTKVNNVTLNDCNITYAPTSTNQDDLEGFAYETTINMGSFAGDVTNASLLSNVADNASLIISNVGEESKWGYRVIHIGSVGYMQSSTMTAYATTGNLTVYAKDWVDGGCHIYLGRVLGSASGNTIRLVEGIGNITYNGEQSAATIGGVAGQTTSVTTISLQKRSREIGQLGGLFQNITITSNTKTNVGGVIGKDTKSTIKEMIVSSTINATIAEGNVGGAVGSASETTLQSIMYDGEVSVTRKDSNSGKIKIGGLFGDESYSYANTFVVMGKLTYESADNNYALAGLSAITSGASKEHYKEGIVSPILQVGSRELTLCENGRIEPLTTSDSDNGRIESSVKYPYELYLYDGMENIEDVVSNTINTNAMPYVAFIDTYYKEEFTKEDILQYIFKYEIGAEDTRYNPGRISGENDISIGNEGYFIVENACNITFGSTFNGVLIGRNTQSDAATSSSQNITNNGIIANIKFTKEDVFTENNGTLFNVMLTREKDSLSLSSGTSTTENGETTNTYAGALVDVNNGYIFSSSVVVKDVTMSRGIINASMLVGQNNGTIMHSYAIGSLTSQPSSGIKIYALVANNSGTIRSSYYAGNIPNVIGGTTTGSKVSGIYADAYAVEEKPTTKNNINFLATNGNDGLQNLGSRVSSFESNTNLQYNYGYPYIKGGMRVDSGSITEYNIYNQADWIKVMSTLGGTTTKATIYIKSNFTLQNLTTLYAANLLGNSNNERLIIDGQAHVITIANDIKNQDNEFGLLSSAEYVTIENLIVTYDKTQTLDSGTTNAGGLIGRAGNVILNNVGVNNFRATGSATTLGGVIGSGSNITTNNVTISNVQLTNNNTNGSVGAFAGYISSLNNSGTITINNPTLTGSARYIGGAIGQLSSALNGTITTGNEGEITAGSNSYVGGLIGYWLGSSSSAILNNSSIAIVRANNAQDATAGAVGGLVGCLVVASDFTINNWTFSSSINNSSNVSTGGLVGEITRISAKVNVNIMSVSTTRSSVVGNGDLGGLIGKSTADVTVSNEVTISSAFEDSATNVGGLIGTLNRNLTIESDVTIENNITGTQYVGGLVGKLTGVFTLDTNTISLPSTIQSTGSSAGGLIGYLEGYNSVDKLTITSNDTITVTANENAGGLIGEHNVTIPSSIAVSQLAQLVNVTATTGHAGGLIGYITSNNSMTLGMSAENLLLGTIETKSSDSSAGGLVGCTQTNIALSTITIGNIENLLIKSPGRAGGLIGYATRQVYVSGTIIFGKGEKLDENFINASHHAGGLFGEVESLEVATNAKMIVQNITLTVPNLQNNRSFGMVVGYVRTFTNDGRVTINNITVTTDVSYVGLVVGQSNEIVKGNFTINNSSLKTESKTVEYLGLVNGYGTVAGEVTLKSSSVIVPDREEIQAENSFDFIRANNAGYSNQELVNMISDSIGGDLSKLWIQNAENEHLAMYNDKWYGKLSKDTAQSYDIKTFPYWMSWGGDDTIIVSTSDNFSTKSNVSIYNYFANCNINATFNPSESKPYYFGLITGYGTTSNCTVHNTNSKITNTDGKKVKIGSFNKMVFVYMEEWNWGCNKWLVMEFSYFIDEEQYSNQSYWFSSDFLSTSSSNKNRIEVKFANSWTKLGDDVKPDGSTSNTFHYNKVTRIVESSFWGVTEYSFETTSHKYAYITPSYLGKEQSWFNYIFNSKLSLETTTGSLYTDNRLGIIQQCMGWTLVDDNKMAVYPEAK